MDKQTLPHPYKGILFTNKKELTMDILNNMDGPQRQNVRLKPNLKCKTVKIEIRSVVMSVRVVGRGCLQKDMGGCALGVMELSHILIMVPFHACMYAFVRTCKCRPKRINYIVHKLHLNF